MTNINPLIYAIKNKTSISQFVDILEFNKNWVDIPDETGKTAIFYAAMCPDFTLKILYFGYLAELADLSLKQERNMNICQIIWTDQINCLKEQIAFVNPISELLKVDVDLDKFISLLDESTGNLFYIDIPDALGNTPIFYVLNLDQDILKICLISILKRMGVNFKYVQQDQLSANERIRLSTLTALHEFADSVN